MTPRSSLLLRLRGLLRRLALFLLPDQELLDPLGDFRFEQRVLDEPAVDLVDHGDLIIRSRLKNDAVGLQAFVLAARQFGIAHLLGILNPDSQQPHQQFVGIPAISDYGVLIPEVLAHPRAKPML